MLHVDYDPYDQMAMISAGESLPSVAWAEVKRVCEERGQDTKSLDARRLVTAWWAFLSFRRALAYVLNKHGVTPQLSRRAEELIARSAQHAADYALAPLVLDPEVLQDRLRDVGFARPLTAEQARNVSRLLALPAAATFSVPGAGKTTEALAVFLLRRQDEQRLLVVAPRNAFSAWEEQLGECVPTLSTDTIRLQGGEAGVESAIAEGRLVNLITYSQLPTCLRPVGRFLTSEHPFMFLDESHRIKRGYSGVQGRSVLRLAHLPAGKLIMSGTPAPNSIGDLVPQFAFLYPELYVDENSVENQIRGVYVRTTKTELGLRPPRRLRHQVGMTTAQRRLYENLRSEAARQAEALSTRDRIRLRRFGACVTRLLQVTSEPALLASTELAEHPLLRSAIDDGPGPKILEACALARRLASRGHKCIIWSQFVQVVESVAAMLADLGADYIHGSVETDDDEDNEDSREAKLKRFHDRRECMVLVANPAACGEGISLHRVCHHAIYIDRSYNAAHYLQSEDRIHRLGLAPDQGTYVTVLCCRDSIDDSVHRRLRAKVDQMGRILDDPMLNIEPFDIDPEIGLSQGDLEDIRRLLLGGA